MKKLITALSLSFILAACSDPPRGPFEVQGKVFMDRELPVQLNFNGRDSGLILDLSTGEEGKFSYTLENEKLIIRLPNLQGGQDKVMETQLHPESYQGDGVDIAVLSPKDDARIAKIAQEVTERKEREKRMSPKGSPSTAEAYTDVATIGDESNDWAAWMALSWKQDQLDDNEKLRMLSRKWNSTNDTFERQGMKAAELSRINQRLQEVRKIEYIKFTNLGNSSAISNPFINTKIDQGSYDFDKKHFFLLGSACSGSNMSSRSNVRDQLVKDQAFCTLPVADETMAREIENLRSNHRLRIDHEVYAKVAYIDKSNNMTLVTTGILFKPSKETYRGPKPEDVLTTVMVWPYK